MVSCLACNKYLIRQLSLLISLYPISIMKLKLVLWGHSIIKGSGIGQNVYAYIFLWNGIFINHGICLCIYTNIWGKYSIVLYVYIFLWNVYQSWHLFVYIYINIWRKYSIFLYAYIFLWNVYQLWHLFVCVFIYIYGENIAYT